MDPQPQIGSNEVLAHITGDIAKAVCERNGESKQQQLIRLQAASRMMLDLKPRDVLEAMLAGHAVMFHAMMTDSIHDTLQGQIDTMRRATRANIVAMNKAFHMNVDRLEHYQQRPSQGSREAAEAVRAAAAASEVARSEPAPAPAPDITPQPQAQAAQPSAAPAPVPAQTPRPLHHASLTLDEIAANSEAVAALEAEDYERFQRVYKPSPEAIAACLANSEAMAALNAGDPTRFAIALGIVKPSEAYIATAGRMGAQKHQTSGGHPNGAGNGRDVSPDLDGTTAAGAD